MKNVESDPSKWQAQQRGGTRRTRKKKKSAVRADTRGMVVVLGRREGTHSKSQHSSACLNSLTSDIMTRQRCRAFTAPPSARVQSNKNYFLASASRFATVLKSMTFQMALR
jgi:hypothetical protein